MIGGMEAVCLSTTRESLTCCTAAGEAATVTQSTTGRVAFISNRSGLMGFFQSYMGFSVGTTMRLRKNSSLFFCMISSVVKPWLPFSTSFCAEDEVLAWSALTGSAAGAGKGRNTKSGLELLSHRQFRIEQPPPTALTLLFGIFILLATRFLAFVPTLRLNHRLHSFLGFLGLLKGPHGGGAPSFAAVLRLSCGQHSIYQHRRDTKEKKRCWLMKHLNMLLKYPFSFPHLQWDS